MLKKSEGLCPSFFHSPQFRKFEPFQKPLLSSFARPFNVFPWNKPKSDKFSENRISKNHRKLGIIVQNNALCQYVKGIKHHTVENRRCFETIWFEGEFVEYHQNWLQQKICCELFEILRCAFNVLSEGKKMIY